MALCLAVTLNFQPQGQIGEDEQCHFQPLSKQKGIKYFGARRFGKVLNRAGTSNTLLCLKLQYVAGKHAPLAHPCQLG